MFNSISINTAYFRISIIQIKLQIHSKVYYFNIYKHVILYKFSKIHRMLFSSKTARIQVYSCCHCDRCTRLICADVSLYRFCCHSWFCVVINGHTSYGSTFYQRRICLHAPPLRRMPNRELIKLESFNCHCGSNWIR